MNFKREIANILEKEFKEDYIDLIEIPPDSKLGDFAFPCFILSKKLNKNPNEIASELSKKLKSSIFEKVEAKGPYLNFFIKKELLAKEILSEIKNQKEKYGRSKENKKIMIEYPAPNTNKPLHLGHVRNIALGQAVTNILKFNGNKVIQVNLNNDRGVHICKAMYAYSKYGKNKKPDKKSDHFVGDFYVLYNKNANEGTEKEIQNMLKKWEEGDKEIVSLWKKLKSQENLSCTVYSQVFSVPR